MATLKKDVITGPIALLADVHGNLAALDAVLAELARRDVERIVVAGDLLFGGDEPLGVWRRLTEKKAQLLRGLSDTALATLDPERLVPQSDADAKRRELFLDARKKVGELVLRALAKLPEQIRLPLADGRELMACHGSPRDPSVDLTFDVDDEELLVLLGGDPADLLAVGGSHVPFDRQVEEARVLGLGSVGQAPEGDAAHFVILSPRLEGTLVERGWVRLGVGSDA
ncbi:MAG: metallophosphoesterase family protein [Deltaproteobacteria bacterium]|jgi:predicted phosphodiesterase